MEEQKLEKDILSSMAEHKKIEMVYQAIQNAKEMIALIYKPDNKSYVNAVRDITDEKVKEYYYEMNSMCCELIDRNVMQWQQEVYEDKGQTH